MNCRDFETVVGEIADGRLMDAAAREAGLGHASGCLECAALLMDARGIGAALRVAAREETEESPARVRQALLAAFAEQHAPTVEAAPGAATEHGAAFVDLASRRAPRRWWLGAAVAVAAAALALLALGLPYFVGGAKDAPRQSAPSEIAAALPSPGPAATPKPTAEVKPTPSLAPDARDGSPKKTTPHARQPRRAANAFERVRTETAARGSAGNQYLPLTYLADATAMESGTVVRVEMSRAALISLGVPVSAERADELLKAEVVIGDDGVARAIRLVGND